MPEELYQELSCRAARAIQQPGDWLITRANYQLLLSRDNAQQTVAVAECKAIFDLEVWNNRLRDIGTIRLKAGLTATECKG